MAGGSCGIGALLLFFHLVPIKPMIPGKEMEYIYERLYFQIWILEMVLLTIGIAAAILGVIGYQSIKEEAVRRAVEEAKNEFNMQFNTTYKLPDREPGQSHVTQEQPEISEEEEER